MFDRIQASCTYFFDLSRARLVALFIVSGVMLIKLIGWLRAASDVVGGLRFLSRAFLMSFMYMYPTSVHSGFF